MMTKKADDIKKELARRAVERKEAKDELDVVENGEIEELEIEILTDIDKNLAEGEEDYEDIGGFDILIELAHDEGYSAYYAGKEVTANSYVMFEGDNADTHNADTHNADTHNADTHNVDTHNVDTHNVDTHNVDTHNVDTHNADTHNLYVAAWEEGWIDAHRESCAIDVIVSSLKLVRAETEEEATKMFTHLEESLTALGEVSNLEELKESWDE